MIARRYLPQGSSDVYPESIVNIITTGQYCRNIQFWVFANLLLLMYGLFKYFSSSMHAVISSTQYVSSNVLNADGKSKLCISIDWWLRI